MEQFPITSPVYLRHTKPIHLARAKYQSKVYPIEEGSPIIALLENN